MAMAVELNNLQIGYGKEILLGPMNLQVELGEFLTVIGPNGSGKTALLKTILGLQTAIGGDVALFGKNPFREMNLLQGCIGYVPQHGLLNVQAPLTGQELLELKGAFSASSSEPLLKMLNLTELILSKPLHSLSGGERQKILILFALLGDPKLVCLDEATDGLDAPSMISLFDYLAAAVKSKKLTTLLVTHDITAVARHSTRVVCLNKAVLFDGDPASSEFHSCLHTVYGTDSVIHNHHNHSH